MPDKLKSGIQWLAGKLNTSVSQTVTYSRGDADVEIQATIGDTATQTQEYDVHQIDYEGRDFIVLASELVFSGTAFEPESGDLITEAEGRVYEVLPIPGGPCWRWSDPHHTMYRIHAKELT